MFGVVWTRKNEIGTMKFMLRDRFFYRSNAKDKIFAMIDAVYAKHSNVDIKDIHECYDDDTWTVWCPEKNGTYCQNDFTNDVFDKNNGIHVEQFKIVNID